MEIPNEHPGVILKEEFLIPLNISAYKLAKATAIPESTLSKIISGKRSISVAVAAKLARYFGNSVEFWIHLQVDYDIRELKSNPDPTLDKIIPFQVA